MSDAIAVGFCFKCQTAKLEGVKHVCMTAEEAMAKSIELDREHDNAAPGTMWLDPVWGVIQIPYHALDLGEPEAK